MIETSPKKEVESSKRWRSRSETEAPESDLRAKGTGIIIIVVVVIVADLAAVAAAAAGGARVEPADEVGWVSSYL